MAAADETLAFYNRTLLDLSAAAGDRADLPGATHHGSAVSPICGSRVTVSLTLDASGVISGFGYTLEACALTKSVVAIMRRAIIGADAPTLRRAHQALANMLEGAPADWPPGGWDAMAVLEGLREHRVRHNAMQLPFVAALQALGEKTL